MTIQFRLYLDLDGVIHAPEPETESEVVEVEIDESRYLRPVSVVRYSPTIVKRLDEIIRTYNVELVWLTTWNENDHVLKLPVLFKALSGGRVIPPAFNHEATNKKEWTQWKADAIIEEQTLTPVPFVWVDDNAHASHSENVHVIVGVVPQLHLTTDSEKGLTLKNLDLIEAFYRELSSNKENR